MDGDSQGDYMRRLSAYLTVAAIAATAGPAIQLAPALSQEQAKAPAVAARNPIPNGVTYLYSKKWHGYYMFHRSGPSVRYMYVPSAGGSSCFKGTWRVDRNRLWGKHYYYAGGFRYRGADQRVWRAGTVWRIGSQSGFRSVSGPAFLRRSYADCQRRL